MNLTNHMPNFLLRVILCAACFTGFLLLASRETNAQNKLANVFSNEDEIWLATELKPNKKRDALPDIEASEIQTFESLLVTTLKAAWKKTETSATEISLAGNSSTDKNDDLNNSSKAAALKAYQSQWKKLNWDLKLAPSENLFVLRESVGHASGRGVYAFRMGAPDSIALQAPHRFNDLLTGSIAISIFREHSVAAIAINTLHRKEIDLSHTKLHYINAFTAAVLKANSSAAIIQLHGFAQEGKEGAAKVTDLIISDTTKFPGRSARQTAAELKTAFGREHTRLFPIEIKTLGGTTNRQSQIAHGLGNPDFLHLEMSLPFRTKLHEDASVRATFFDSILQGVAK